MFRNQYDGDITTWSPQGKLYQLEYAMEAVKQGSAAIGIKSKTHVVLVTLKRTTSELASYQKKIFQIDHHLGIAIAGLTADARFLSKYMRNECVNHKFVFSSPMQVSRLVGQIADKSQVHTQRYGRRPYGVGLLVAGYDQTGAHLMETCPSGNCYDYKAQAIGARAQSAKTYLEKHLASFEACTLQQLIIHGLSALSETLSSNVSITALPGSSSQAKEKELENATTLTSKNCTVGVVGENLNFKILEGPELQQYLDQMNQSFATGPPGAPAPATTTTAGAPPPSGAGAPPPSGAGAAPPAGTAPPGAPGIATGSGH